MDMVTVMAIMVSWSKTEDPFTLAWQVLDTHKLVISEQDLQGWLLRKMGHQVNYQ